MPLRVISRFSTENLLPHSTDDFRRATLVCFTKFVVSKKFMDKKGGRREGGSRFKVNCFCLTVPKKFVGETFCAVFQKSSGSQIVFV